MATADTPTVVALLIAACAVLVSAIAHGSDVVVELVRRRSGLPTGDHCEHCPEVDVLSRDLTGLRDELTALCSVVRDHVAVFAAIRADAEQHPFEPHPGRAAPADPLPAPDGLLTDR